MESSPTLGVTVRVSPPMNLTEIVGVSVRSTIVNRSRAESQSFGAFFENASALAASNPQDSRAENARTPTEILALSIVI